MQLNIFQSHKCYPILCSKAGRRNDIMLSRINQTRKLSITCSHLFVVYVKRKFACRIWIMEASKHGEENGRWGLFN